MLRCRRANMLLFSLHVLYFLSLTKAFSHTLGLLSKDCQSILEVDVQGSSVT